MRFSCALFLVFFYAPSLFAQEVQEVQRDAALNFLSGLSNDSGWNLIQSTPLQFNVHHPQGMTRIGDVFFMTSVETIVRPEPSAEDSNYDRTPGEGIGHLFKFDLDGKLLASVELGEGTMYHPGGIDYDGEYVWVSVAEYRPDSHAIIYRIDPDSLEIEEIIRFDDHLGAVARNAATGDLIGVSWGSRRLYRWPEQAGSYDSARFDVVDKQGSDVDYQDCQIVAAQFMACSGIGSRQIDNTHLLTLGGIELVNLDELSVSHKIRVTGTAPGHEFLTRNPFWFQYTDNDRGTFFFVPEDERATLYQYAPPQQ